MTTYTNSSDPTLSTFLMWKLQNALANRSTKASIGKNRSSVGLYGIVRLLLHIAGFGLLTMAGFQFSMIAGLVVAGFSCFVMSYLFATPDNSGGGNADVRR